MQWNRYDLEAFVQEVWGIKLLPWQLEDLFKFVNGGLFSYSLPTDHGKRTSVRTLVHTTTGRKCHGDLRPGDWVFGPDGLPTPVLGMTAPAPCDHEVFF